MENLDSVKSNAKSNFKMCLIGYIQGFHDQNRNKIRIDILQIFAAFPQVEIKSS